MTDPHEFTTHSTIAEGMCANSPASKLSLAL
jgi:hypothetical protein